MKGNLVMDCRRPRRVVFRTTFGWASASGGRGGDLKGDWWLFVARHGWLPVCVDVAFLIRAREVV